MVKVYKPGKVAIVLQGRQAGKKVVVIKQYEERANKDGDKSKAAGDKPRNYPYAVVAGIERYPRKVTRRMGQKKVINYSHLFPTRYALELEGLKGIASTETVKDPSKRVDAKKAIKKLFEERYQSGKNRWFFQPLRF